MVTIKIPVGTGGWMNEGWVQINGKVYTFPIGVETQVPEAVAHQINEIIQDSINNQPPAPKPPAGSIATDKTLTVDGAAADAKVTGEKITSLTEEIANKKGLTSAQITDLDNMFKVCAYTSSAETAYAAFCAAFGITGDGTGGDSGEGSDEVNVYFADYSEWPIWGAGISVVENGFTVTSDRQSSGIGIALGILHPGKYNDYKEKTLAISMDVAENFEAGGTYPAYLATYSDVPETNYVENQTASKIINPVKDGNHVRYTVDLSSVAWGNTPNDNDYLAFRFYCYFVGTATFTNFSVEVV